ncbi:MAG: flavodoxin [Oscillospiraceae bacterium]
MKNIWVSHLLVAFLIMCTACSSESSSSSLDSSELSLETVPETTQQSIIDEGETVPESEESVSEIGETITENKELVIYFSATGTTEKIAFDIADLRSADIFSVTAAEPYSDADLNWHDDACRANREQQDKNIRPEISGSIDNMESYNIVFLGYPIWWGEEPRIIDTFLESYDFSDKTVISFCTSGSSGISTSENNIRNLVPIGEQLSGRRFSANASVDDVSAWLDTLDLSFKAEEQKLNIDVNGYTLTASLEDNSSAQALKELLKNGSITIEMSDYGNFEKVGTLPETLPRNDERITTEAGNLILYQGNQITIYYDVNTWNFTKLGHIDNITQEELKSILGDGNVTAKLSLQ